ncbi:DUF6615 family protein [Roseovarius arcticus]|uniref:DUF6615 family protein n=1 Tax=Roseovarius arcticus TaxID=2547404 RepID=UPI001110D383|nr:DUF6615 family protein [Roseovarius arcticus]
MTVIASGDLRAYLRGLAHRVWADQTEARQFGLKLQEESITEMLLLQIARDLSPLGLRVRMFSKRQEGGYTRKDGTVVTVANGADWEWFIDLPDCMVGFRVQAKRLFGSARENGSYKGFKPGGTQIDDLVNAAGTDMNPVYVFYNHGFTRNSSLFKRSTTTNWFGSSAWGCSVASAASMKALKSKTLVSVLPGMVPWHRFFALGENAGRGCTVSRMLANMPGNQAFKVATKRPDWLGLLLNMRADQRPDQLDVPEIFGDDDASEDGEPEDDTPMNRFLRKRGLNGVAYFDFRKES